MRELADEIFNNSLRLNLKQNPVLDDLEVLDGFFEVAKAQNWVQAVDVLRIQEEYNRIKAEIKKITREPAGVRPESDPRVRLPNLRQEKILAILKENGQAQVWQVKQVFPEVSKRTLRRDFEFLLKQGKIERIGERNNTFYRLKG